jgi:hypothetical protein
MDSNRLAKRQSGGSEKFIYTLSRVSGLRCQEREPVYRLFQAYPVIGNLPGCPIRQPVGVTSNSGGKFTSVGSDKFGRSRWRGGTNVCNEV